MLKSIIIDDEVNSRELLTTLLQNYTEDVKVLGSAINVREGLNLINAHKPDIIFLDIEMPDGTGFELLDTLASAQYLICFTTGYDQYAIKAIEYGAFGYLLKPIDLENLRKVVTKAKNHLNTQRNIAPRDKSNTIIVNDKEKYWVLKYDDIINIESAGNYSIIYTIEHKKLLCDNTLNQLEEGLKSDIFFRCHRSHIINLKHLNFVEKGRTGTAQLNNEMIIPIANRRLKDFKTAVKGLK